MTSLTGNNVYSSVSVFNSDPLLQGDSNLFVKNQQEDVQLGNLILTGDLVVQGTSTSVSDLNITDPLIKLANNNSTNANLNIGFFGVYLSRAYVEKPPFLKKNHKYSHFR